MCSPGFIAGLREKYDSNAREKERQIQREIAKRDFHHSKSEEAVKDVHERITRHLTITEVQLMKYILIPHAHKSVYIIHCILLTELFLKVRDSFLQVTYDPEAEADMGPVEISAITPAMEQVG